MSIELVGYVFFILSICDGLSEPHQSTMATANSTTASQVPLHRYFCTYAPGILPGDDELVEECCNIYVQYFTYSWTANSLYLSTLLETLKQWNCSAFEKECRKRSFAFTKLSNLIYDRYCNVSSLVENCGMQVVSLLHAESSFSQSLSSDLKHENLTLTTWKALVHSGNFTVKDQINDPCVQIAMFDSKYGGYGSYHEISDATTPFCGFSRCGYVGKTLQENKITIWNCVSETCRVCSIITIVIEGVLSVAVLFANITVLYVMAHYSNLRNSQAYYKISLAVADLLVGLIILPTFISSTVLKLFFVHSVGQVRPLDGYLANETVFGRYVNATVNLRRQGTLSLEGLSQSYLSFVGFVTTVSLVVSVYTLMAASFDRLWVVFRPLAFDKDKAMRNAKYFTICLWILAILLACIPFFTGENLKYGLVASSIICFVTENELGIIMYLIAFVIPLVIVWCTTGAMHYISTKQARLRRSLMQQSEKAKMKCMERRLTKTLAIMVLAFTLSLVPMVFVLISSIASPYVRTVYPSLLHPPSLTGLSSMEYVASMILMCNSLWNCIVYNLRNNEFNAATKKTYGRLLRAIGLTCLVKTSSANEDSRGSIPTNSSSKSTHAGQHSSSGATNSTRV